VGNRQLKTIFEQRAVRQSCQQVMIGLEIDEGFSFLPLSNVTSSPVIAGATAISASLR
jgi:hypothetical protein